MKKVSPKLRLVVALVCAAGLAVTLITAAAANSHGKWWQYDPGTAKGSWRESSKLVQANKRWEEKHPDANDHDTREFRKSLQERYQEEHLHSVISTQSGTASWYGGGNGACGGHLHGYFAASRTLPCGSLVSVRASNGK